MPLDDRQAEMLEGHTRQMLEKRVWPKTICPSEIARALSKEELDMLEAENWRDAMESVRQIVWQMKGRGEVDVLQKGHIIDATSLQDVHGPIRARATKR